MQKSVNIFNKQPNWTIIGLISIVGAFIFFAPFISTIAISALMAYLLFPVYRRLSKRMSENIAAPITLVISFLVIIIPIVVIIVMVLTQALSFAESLSSATVSTNSTVAAIDGPVVANINAFFAPIGNPEVISQESVATFVQQTLPVVIQSIANLLLGIFSSLPQLLTGTIVYCFLFTAFIRFSKQMIKFLNSLSPFDESLTNKYVEKSGVIVTASLKGQFVISIVTAVSSALLLFVLGLQEYFLFFVVIFTILGMIPLGSGIVMIPIAIIAMITGDFWPGFWVLTIYLLVICNIDSVLRPRLIPKKANLIPALTTLATFCGIAYFGILGIVYGPLIVIILKTTADIYIATRRTASAQEVAALL